MTTPSILKFTITHFASIFGYVASLIQGFPSIFLDQNRMMGGIENTLKILQFRNGPSIKFEK